MIPLDTSWLPHILWESPIGFTLLVSTLAALIGGATGSLTIAAVAGYSMFMWIGIYADITLLTNVMLVVTVLFAISFGFKIWRLEGLSG